MDLTEVQTAYLLKPTGPLNDKRKTGTPFESLFHIYN